jgi:hypothetical protein
MCVMRVMDVYTVPYTPTNRQTTAKLPKGGSTAPLIKAIIFICKSKAKHHPPLVFPSTPTTPIDPK